MKTSQGQIDLPRIVGAFQISQEAVALKAPIIGRCLAAEEVFLRSLI